MSPPPVIETRGLTKDFGDVRAVEGLDLSIMPGEIFGYLGPNGAGKTTTIRLLLDLVRPTSGTVSVLGGNPRDPAVRRRIGYLPGELRFDGRYTPGRLLDLYGDIHGSIDEEFRDALLRRFDLDPRRPIGELSTGNRRKVAIVRAFMHRPALLLLDEPSSGLDPLLQHQFHLLVREAVEAGASVLLSSHVLPEVEALADRVGIIRDGRLRDVAGVDELRQRALQRIVLHVSGRPDVASVFGGLPEVVSAEYGGGVVRLTVEGSVDRVLRAATASLTVERIVAQAADLEEIFLRLYGKEAP